MEDDVQLARELAQQGQGVQGCSGADDCGDFLIPNLVAMAERAVEDRGSPMFSQSGDLRQFVSLTGCCNDPAGEDAGGTAELNEEPFIGFRDVQSLPIEDFNTVGVDLGACDVEEFCGGAALMAEVAVHGFGRCIAR